MAGVWGTVWAVLVYTSSNDFKWKRDNSYQRKVCSFTANRHVIHLYRNFFLLLVM